MNSRELAYILRHNPGEYGLTPDEEGWCDVTTLLINAQITLNQLMQIVSNNTRFIISKDGSKIKAAHGHSFNVKYTNSMRPPLSLYHGTKMSNLKNILKDGIKKMNRSHVHLSSEVKDAWNIAKRRKGVSIVLIIKSLELYDKEKQSFYKSEDNVWLTDDIPPEYIFGYIVDGERHMHIL